jgi:hypothetical protein
MNYLELSNNATKTAILQLREMYPNITELTGIVMVSQNHIFDKKGNIIK